MGSNGGPISDVLVRSDNTSGEINIHGEVFHKSKDELLAQYQELPLRSFLQEEARRSAGNYLLIDHQKDGFQIITAPGYSGGYIYNNEQIVVGTQLSTVLNEIGFEDISLDSDTLTLFFERSFPPIYSTGFENTICLPPAYLIKVEDDEIVTEQAYAGIERDRPSSLDNALKEMVEPLEQKVNEDEVTLLFSGGRDSTCFYIALAELFGEDCVQVATVDVGPNTNGFQQAENVSDKLGVDLTYLDFDSPPTQKSALKEIETHLRNDLCTPFAPHRAVAGHDDVGEIVLQAENFDEMVTVAMFGRQLTFPQHIRATKDISSVAVRLGMNFQYTNLYAKNELLRKYYTHAVSLLFESGNFDTQDPSFEGILKGMASSSYPNLLQKDHNSTLSQDIRRFYRAARTQDSVKMLHLFKHYWENNHWNKLIGSEVVQPDHRVYLPSMWGPTISYFIGQGQGMKDMWRPKYELTQYIKQKRGFNINEVAYNDYNEYRRVLEQESQHKDKMKSTLLPRNEDALDPDESRLLMKLNNDSKAFEFEKRFNHAREIMNRPVDMSTLQDAHRLLNLELLLRNTG